MYIMNKVWEIGRLTKEPEIRYISKKNGKGEEESTVTASYTLAVARGWTAGRRFFPLRCLWKER